MSTLYFTPRTQIDANTFNFALGQEDIFDWDYDVRNGVFIFEEQEELLDALEKDLQLILDANDINGYFESC